MLQASYLPVIVAGHLNGTHRGVVCVGGCLINASNRARDVSSLAIRARLSSEVNKDLRVGSAPEAFEAGANVEGKIELIWGIEQGCMLRVI